MGQSGSGNATGPIDFGGSSTATGPVIPPAGSAEQLIQEIKDEIGYPDLNDKVDLWWGNYILAYPSNTTLTYLYTRWKVLTLLLQKYREAVDIGTGQDRTALGQIYKNTERAVASAWNDILLTDPLYSDTTSKSMKSVTLSRNLQDTTRCWKPYRRRC